MTYTDNQEMNNYDKRYSQDQYDHEYWNRYEDERFSSGTNNRMEYPNGGSGQGFQTENRADAENNRKPYYARCAEINENAEGKSITVNGDGTDPLKIYYYTIDSCACKQLCKETKDGKCKEWTWLSSNSAVAGVEGNQVGVCILHDGSEYTPVQNCFGQCWSGSFIDSSTNDQ